MGLAFCLLAVVGVGNGFIGAVCWLVMGLVFCCCVCCWS